MRYIFIILLSLANIVFGAKDCPGDMVLWRQPGSFYSDCVCPTGQSMVSNLYDINLHTFGKCSDSYIPVSKTWANDISNTLSMWIDAFDPYRNGYITSNGVNFATIYDKQGPSYPGCASYNINSFSQNVSFVMNPSNLTSQYPGIRNTNFNRSGGVNYTVFMVINYQSGAVVNELFSNSTTTSYSGAGCDQFLNAKGFAIAINSSNKVRAFTNFCAKYTSGYCSWSTVSAITPISTIFGNNQIIVFRVNGDPSTSRTNTGCNGNLILSLINSNSGYNNNFDSNNSSYVTNLNFTCESGGISLGSNIWLSSGFNLPEGQGGYTGNMNEFLLYTSALTDSQITQVLSILNQKWQVF